MLWLRLLGTWPKRRLLSKSSDVSKNYDDNVTWKMENMETVVTLRGQLLSKSDNDHFSMKMVVMMMMVIVRIRLCQRQ